MNAQFLYLTDPLTLEFDTEIRETLQLPGGRLGVILTRTYFYPTGGGQEHDTGTLGAARVLDVFKSDDRDYDFRILDETDHQVKEPVHNYPNVDLAGIRRDLAARGLSEADIAAFIDRHLVR